VSRPFQPAASSAVPPLLAHPQCRYLRFQPPPAARRRAGICRPPSREDLSDCYYSQSWREGGACHQLELTAAAHLCLLA
jgi:hypothetical protein